VRPFARHDRTFHLLVAVLRVVPDHRIPMPSPDLGLAVLAEA
jgi:hypothetical protein